MLEMRARVCLVAGRMRRMCAALSAALLAASLATACSGGGDGDTSTGGRGNGAAGAAVPVVVDTDLAVDDLVALTFLLSSTRADVRAITVSGTGEVRCPQGLRVIRGLLAVTGDEDVPVACGRSTPLAGDHAFPVAGRDLADSGWGANLPQVAPPPTERSAVDLLGSTLRDGVTVLTLGPLTDVAETFRADPDLAQQVASIVVMGGAVDVPGNVSGEGMAPSTAEWNMYVDPVAAAEVLGSGAPILLVGLDASDRLPVTGDFLEVLGVNAHTRPAELVDGLIRNNPQVYTGQAYFWDPLAAAIVVDPGLVSTEKAAIGVVTAPGRDNGRTVRRLAGSPVAIAVRPRRAAFERLLVGTIDQLEPGAAIATPPAPVGRGAIRFDGRGCTYDGPATVPTGRMRFTFRTTSAAWYGAVVGLTGERTGRAILRWLEAHPRNRATVPGVSQATPVPPRVATYVDVVSPGVAVICASDQPRPLLAATVRVR